MSGQNKLNLDKLAADCAREMLKADDKDTLERLITKTLGILQSQGVYAMMLFLFSRTSKENDVAPFIRKPLYQALLELPQFTGNSQLRSFKDDDGNHAEVLRWFSDNVVDELDKLLIVRDLYEQGLIYARFHAKAAQKGESS